MELEIKCTVRTAAALTRMELDPGWRAHGCVLKGGPIYLQIEVGMISAATLTLHDVNCQSYTIKARALL